MRTGWKTTEFWVAWITALVMLVAQFTGHEMDTKGLVAVLVPVIGYFTTRTLVKVKKGT